jgi:putative transposase
MEEMGTDGDHVYLFVGTVPKYPPSRVTQILKSISARKVFKHFPEPRSQWWGGEFWRDGGYIGTVGDGVSTEIVKRYIQEQGDEKDKARIQELNPFSIWITRSKLRLGYSYSPRFSLPCNTSF